MGKGEIELGIRGERVSSGDHIAYFWQNEGEFAEGVKFIETGLRGEDHCVLFGYEEANDRVCSVLSERGFDVGALEAAGRLTLLGGESDGDLMLSNIAASFAAPLKRGAKLIRLLGNIGWGRPTGLMNGIFSPLRPRSRGQRKPSQVLSCVCTT
jgi:MEDS: MEthanogen/methylotroph, DcmR Sensory domain